MSDNLEITTEDKNISLEEESKLQDKQNAPPVEEPEKPQIPAKFLDENGNVRTEDLAKAYAELEKKLGQPKGDEKPKTDDDTPPPTDEIQIAKKQIEDKGLDWDNLVQEYENNEGKLSEATLKDLEKKGIPRETVDRFVEGQAAMAREYWNSVLEVGGGAEAMQEMTEWASENWSDDEIDTFNQTLQTGNKNQAKLAIQGLKAAFRDANGSAPDLALGGKGGPGGLQPYTSTDQVVRDMANPLYKTDEAYRAQVEKRLSISDIY